MTDLENLRQYVEDLLSVLTGDLATKDKLLAVLTPLRAEGMSLYDLRVHIEIIKALNEVTAGSDTREENCHLALDLLHEQEMKEQSAKARRLSRMLWDCRENLEMWRDVVRARTGQEPTHVNALITEVDAYRAEQGWSPNGFGGE